MKKLFVLLLILSILVSGSTQVTFAHAVPLVPEVPAPIYIRSDGKIDPPTGNIHQMGNTYILTGNLNASIEVQMDHVLIEGNGFSVTQPSINTTGFNIPAGFYPGIRLNDRVNVTVQNVKIHGCISGITLERATNIILVNNTLTEISKIAIFSVSSSDSVFTKNDIIRNDQGMLIINSNRIHISENNISRNRIGIQTYGIGHPNHYIAIIQNNIYSNQDMGITVDGGYQNIIVGNHIANNGKGLLVSYADCLVHHNNFVNNVENVKSNTCPGPWDDGKEGNYWSDYNGIDLNGNGIGDTPYIVETLRTWIEPTTNSTVTFGVNAQDNFPHMTALDISSVNIELPKWAEPAPLPSSSLLPEPEDSPTPQPSFFPEHSSLPESSTKQELFPIKLFIGSIFVVGVVCLGLLFYFQKRQGG
jgi:hypothetical protein